MLVARRREPMQALAAELHAAGTEITVISTDLGEPGSAAELMKIIEDRGLVIDTLINNAGLGDSGRFDQTDAQKIAAMLQVNVVALTELTPLGVAANGGAPARQDHARCFHGCVPARPGDGGLLRDQGLCAELRPRDRL